MLMTLVALLCQPSSGACVEEIITDQTTMQACAVHGEVGVSAWMAESPIYSKGWTLARWKCVPPDYRKARAS